MTTDLVSLEDEQSTPTRDVLEIGDMFCSMRCALLNQAPQHGILLAAKATTHVSCTWFLTSFPSLIPPQTSVCASFRISLGSQNGNHLPDDRRCGQGHFRFWGSRPGIEANRQVRVSWGNCVQECWPYRRDQPARATGQPTTQTAWLVIVRPVDGTAPAQSKDAQSRGHGTHVVRVCNPEPHRRSPYDARLTTDCSWAASEGRNNIATVITCSLTQTRLDWLWEREDDRAKTEDTFRGFVALMDNERLPKRVVSGEVDGGKGYSGGQEQDWMGCLERDLTLFNLPTRIEALDVGIEEAGCLVQTGRGSGRSVH